MENFYWVEIQYDDDENADTSKLRLSCLQTTRKRQKQESSEKFPASFSLLVLWNLTRVLYSIRKTYLT